MSYRIISSDSDLIAGWNMDQRIVGTVSDVSGNGYDGSTVGAPVQYSNRFGYSIRGLVGNEAINFSDIDLTGEFSILMVFDVQDLSSNNWIIGDQVATTKIGFVGSNYFIRVIGGGSSDNTITANTGLQMVTVTRNSANKIDLFINDGVANRLFSDVAQSGTSEWSRSLNQDILGSLQSLNGNLYNVAIYDVAKSAEWITQEYNRMKLYF